MQHGTPPCQLPAPRSSDSRLISPESDGTECPQSSPDTHTATLKTEHLIDYSGARFALVRGTHQEVTHTASRRSGPRRWRGAVVWLIAAGLHPRANATTQKVADDLAQRMDYDTGHVLYGMDAMAARLGISRASVARHIGYLRELGALAWVQHGSRLNLLHRMGLKGYAGTATVYAAVIPPCFDHAMGHRIIGSGYTARIVVDYRSTPKPVDNPAVDNSGSQVLETPSLTSVEEEGKLKVDGGSNYTSPASRDSRVPTQRSSKSSSNGTGRHALQVAQDIRIARQVRPLVTWTQREGLRRLAFALRPLIDRGLDAYGIAAFLNGLCDSSRWRPKAPANYIRTVLADRQQRAERQEQAAARYELENPIEGSFQAPVGVRINLMAALDEGLARYRHNMQARGHEDLSHGATTTSWDAEADILAFLNGSPS